MSEAIKLYGHEGMVKYLDHMLSAYEEHYRDQHVSEVFHSLDTTDTLKKHDIDYKSHILDSELNLILMVSGDSDDIIHFAKDLHRVTRLHTQTSLHSYCPADLRKCSYIWGKHLEYEPVMVSVEYSSPQPLYLKSITLSAQGIEIPFESNWCYTANGRSTIVRPMLGSSNLHNLLTDPYFLKSLKFVKAELVDVEGNICTNCELTAVHIYDKCNQSTTTLTLGSKPTNLPYSIHDVIESLDSIGCGIAFNTATKHFVYYDSDIDKKEVICVDMSTLVLSTMPVWGIREEHIPYPYSGELAGVFKKILTGKESVDLEPVIAFFNAFWENPDVDKALYALAEQYRG